MTGGWLKVVWAFAVTTSTNAQVYDAHTSDLRLLYLPNSHLASSSTFRSYRLSYPYLADQGLAREPV